MDTHIVVNKLIGIYKIISPTGKIYIGQSIDIERRWREHQKECHKGGLKSSFKKHGFENHKFEIKEECSIELLNERERYWQDFYDVLGPNGLNLVLTDTINKRKLCSEETKKRISESRKGIIFSEEHKRRIGLASKNMSLETREKISKKNSGRVLSRETKEKISKSSSERRHSEETKKKIGESSRTRIRKPVSLETRQKISEGITNYWKNKKK